MGESAEICQGFVRHKGGWRETSSRQSNSRTTRQNTESVTASPHILEITAKNLRVDVFNSIAVPGAPETPVPALAKDKKRLFCGDGHQTYIKPGDPVPGHPEATGGQ